VSKEYVDVPVKQLVVRLADKGEYLASESTFYRVLRKNEMVKERRTIKPSGSRVKETHTAYNPNEVWSWDITYLPTKVKGVFFYLYLFMDIFSRKIVTWRIEKEEKSVLAAELVEEIAREEKVIGKKLVLHSDNGAPMKGASMLATLENLGVSKSFSRPRVSNDNPYSESLFKTAKYSAKYPEKLGSVEE
jgi:putative transposase